MSNCEDMNLSCVVNNASEGRASLSIESAAPIQRVESVEKLVDSKPSTYDVGVEPALRIVYEYARVKKDQGSCPSSEAVQAMLEVLTEEIQKADLELEMLALRRNALANRSRLLQKLARILRRKESPSPLSDVQS
ncbi:MAG: hypothetical protein GX141_03230 [Armatimonadetes bacterium]|nr:hypothetical protein [Armatimonadota bacterium]